MTSKPWWKSKTLWGALITLWLAINPDLREFFEESRLPTGAEYFDLLSLVISTGITIYGRYTAHTPLNLPGQH